MDGTRNDGCGGRAAALVLLVLLALAGCGGGDYPVDAPAEPASLAAAAPASQAGANEGLGTIDIAARPAEAPASAAGPSITPRHPSAGEDATEGSQARVDADAEGPHGDAAQDGTAGPARRPGPPAG